MSIYQAVIADYPKSISDNKKVLIESLILKSNHHDVYLFGRNDLSSCLSELIDINGYIDDYADDLIWKDKSVFALRNISNDSIVINCVNNARPATALKRIQSFGITKILSYSDFCKALPDLVPLPEFVKKTRKDILENHEKWNLVFGILNDADSKKVLHDVISFRLTGDLEALHGYAYRPEDQYFESFLVTTQVYLPL